MTEESNRNIPDTPSIPSDIYTPIDPTANDLETSPANVDGHADQTVKQPRLNAEIAPDSPRAYDNGDGDPDDPKRQTPGHHAADRAFEYDDEETVETR